MSQLLGIVFFTGAVCISPVDVVERQTIVHRVPCAEPVRAPLANPFKLAQEQNVVTLPPPSKPTKASRCGAKKTVWFVKNGKRRYRCR